MRKLAILYSVPLMFSLSFLAGVVLSKSLSVISSSFFSHLIFEVLGEKFLAKQEKEALSEASSQEANTLRSGN